MDEIGRKFGIEVKREEIEAEISRQAVARGVDRAKLRAYYYKNETYMSRLSNKLFYDKISDLVLKNIKIKHVGKLSAEAGETGEKPANAGSVE
jgi:FKBP-type peptidyl-prolyl cis-trans isomerase (trigger factor)